MAASKRRPKIAVIATFEGIRIYFGSVLHLHLDRTKLLGLTSWRATGGAKFCIEYTMEGGSIQTEYDDEAKFRFILDELERLL